MKDDYTEEQVIYIIKLAKKWKITPEKVREMLNQLYDANFWEDLDWVDDTLTEQAMDNDDPILEIINDRIRETADEVRQEMELNNEW